MEGDDTKTSVVNKAERKLPSYVSNVAVNRTGGFGSHEFYKEKEEEKRQERLKECKVGGEGAAVMLNFNCRFSFLLEGSLLTLSLGMIVLLRSYSRRRHAPTATLLRGRIGA